MYTYVYRIEYLFCFDGTKCLFITLSSHAVKEGLQLAAYKSTPTNQSSHYVYIYLLLECTYLMCIRECVYSQQQLLVHKCMIDTCIMRM